VLDLVEETIVLGPRDLAVLRPRDAEALLDEDAFEHEEFLPYWAELWPSGVELARHVAGLDLAGARVLEIGCGLALPSFAAALAGAHAVATDWAPDAIELARRNAERNGIELELVVAAWSRPKELRELGPFDLVLAADVLYERRNVEPLLEQLRSLAPVALVGLAGRPYEAEFLRLAGGSVEVAPRVVRIEWT
jgi:predicted nicotinamide N-methyase